MPLEGIVAGLQRTRAAFGRAESVTLGGPADPRELRILLVKNPAGANEVLRTLALEPGEHDLLGVLNDHIADGRDISWIWDADFELLAGRVRSVTCWGTRAEELAVRLKYAGIEGERIRVEGGLAAALDAGAGRLQPPEGSQPAALCVADLHRDAVAARAAGRARPAGRAGAHCHENAARVRAVPGPDEHLRRPRQPAGAGAPLRVARDRLPS